MTIRCLQFTNAMQFQFEWLLEFRFPWSMWSILSKYEHNVIHLFFSILLKIVLTFNIFVRKNGKKANCTQIKWDPSFPYPSSIAAFPICGHNLRQSPWHLPSIPRQTDTRSKNRSYKLGYIVLIWRVTLIVNHVMLIVNYVPAHACKGHCNRITLVVKHIWHLFQFPFSE